MNHDMTCRCWVSKQPELNRYGIRYGAHSLACPAYRESLDPVDRASDRELCEARELHVSDADAAENAAAGLIMRIY